MPESRLLALMTDHVPTEIWFHIAHYIPDEILYDMLGVNRLFFDLAMDARYKQITLKSLNAETLKLVDRLRLAKLVCTL